jgi:hypothetical protein
MESGYTTGETSSCDQVFVIRCWRETPAAGQADSDWRVRLSRINTRERIHVFGLENAFELIRRFLAEVAVGHGDRDR